MTMKGSGSDVSSSFIIAAAADPDGISVAASVSGAANLTIGGTLASGGSVTFDSPRNVTILSAADDSGITFTVTGTDESGTSATETITGADTGTATGTSFFATVTQIATSGSSAGNVSAGSGTSICGVMSTERMRLRGIYVVNGSSAATISFREGSATGTVVMQYRTIAGASTNSYPDVPDDGLLFKSGGYVTFTAVTDLTAMTTFQS